MTIAKKQDRKNNIFNKVMRDSSLRFRIIAVLLIVSLFPLFFVGIGSWTVFGRLLEKKSLELQQTVVESHADAIESYLSERLNSLKLIAATHSFQDIINPNILLMLFDELNKSSDGGFIDFGVVDSNGDHRAYIGEYDLLEKNYKDAEWFKIVSLKSEYISDVFLGFRGVPHCIIAVKSNYGSEHWFLRATINSDQFDAIVKTEKLGMSGETYIVNKQGHYQTTPRDGSVLDKSPLTNQDYFNGLRSRKVMVNGSVRIQVTTWINDNNWLLVAQQDESEVREPVNSATASGLIIVLLAVVLIVVTTIFATWHLTGQIDKANTRRDEMHRAFLRSAKLASIGELATGLAHEINNPLAIINADQTNIEDIIAEVQLNDDAANELKESVERSKRQIERCKSITTKMLQFGRSRDSQLMQVDISIYLKEILTLLLRQSKVRNIDIKLDTEKDLPRIFVDSVELEQVIMNLVQNSFYALPKGGHIWVKAFCNSKNLVIEVADDGDGIAKHDLDRIFEPFFTTKPVGQGTGLGLSVCYGIIHSWGGRMEVQSEEGKGTTISIYIPVHQKSPSPHNS